MRDRALTLSDGSKVQLSTHQIELLGPDERAAAEHFERIRSVRDAVLSWAASKSDMETSSARGSCFHRAVSMHQYNGHSVSWALKSDCAKVLFDDDFADLSGFMSKGP